MNLAGGLDSGFKNRILKVSLRFEELVQFKQKKVNLSKIDHHGANTDQDNQTFGKG